MRKLNITTKRKNGEATPATLMWEEDFDHTVCMSCFQVYGEAIDCFGEAEVGYDELARMFLLGCRYGVKAAKAGRDISDLEK